LAVVIKVAHAWVYLRIPNYTPEACYLPLGVAKDNHIICSIIDKVLLASSTYVIYPALWI